MRYVKLSDGPKAARLIGKPFEDHDRIHQTGSVSDMQRVYRWPRAGQVLYGDFIYNLGPEAVKLLVDAKLAKGR